MGYGDNKQKTVAPESANAFTKNSMDKKSNTTVKKLTVEETVNRKANGLCFYYDENFSMGHKRKKLFSIKDELQTEESDLLNLCL